jgi:pentalenene oxygenase
VRDPDEIWRVLVTDADSFRPGKWKRRAHRFVGPTLNTLHGAEHRERRRALTPALARPRVDACAGGLEERAAAASGGLATGRRLRLRELLDPLCLTMAGDVLLSTDLLPRAPALASDLGEVMASLPRLLPPLRGTRHGRALARLDDAVGAILDDRRASGEYGDDLLGALLQSGLPDPIVRGELIAFLLAAVDEPPSALEAVWYLLARHPDADARLHAELDAVLGGRAPALAERASLPRLDAVLREALRLFPPARHIDRCPVHDVQIGGEHLAAGANVVISPLVTHGEPELHERPAEFDPDRWLDRARDGRRGSYLPFGAGVHTCLGEPLARAVMTVVLAAVAQHWRLEIDDEASAPGPRAPDLRVTVRRR